MPFKVGLTGNLGSGKTAASNLFAKLGASIVDADLIVHALLDAPSQAILAFSEKHMGREAIEQDGRIARHHVREKILKKPALRQAWEQLLEPNILAALRNPGPTETYHLLVIPLLFERNLGAMVDRTCLIVTPHHLLYPRISARDGWPDEHISAILKLQMPPKQQMLMADDVIANDGSEADLQQCVATLHDHYMTTAKKSNGIH